MSSVEDDLGNCRRKRRNLSRTRLVDFIKLLISEPADGDTFGLVTFCNL